MSCFGADFQHHNSIKEILRFIKEKYVSGMVPWLAGVSVYNSQLWRLLLVHLIQLQPRLPLLCSNLISAPLTTNNGRNSTSMGATLSPKDCIHVLLICNYKYVLQKNEMLCLLKWIYLSIIFIYHSPRRKFKELATELVSGCLYVQYICL